MQDLSIESGTWYKYSIHILDKETGRTLYTPVETELVMCVFEDIFLVSGNMQIRLQFNPSVSGFKYNVAESQQVTLGGRYPYIKRNGNNYYRTFSISGLISSLTDETDWYDAYLFHGNTHLNYDFTIKDHLDYHYNELYSDYDNEHNISKYLNPTYERLFR